MGQKQGSEIAREVMRDKTPIAINLDVSDAWVLLGAIQEQLSRYPNLQPFLKTQLIKFAAQLERPILLIHPESKDLILAGWDFVESGDEIRAQIDRFLVSANDPNYR